MPESQTVNAPGTSLEAQEEWLLANIQDAAIPLPSFAAVLNRLHTGGHVEGAESGAELLLETLAARRDESALLELLSLQADWHGTDPQFSATCAKHLIMFFQKDTAALALIPHAGFNRNVPAAECLRRFTTLRRLRPEALCYEKTWGFGIVAEIDAYAHQVIIDFENKKSHRMALAYAAETLALLDDDHLLARRHRDRPAFADWLDKDPAGVVVCALRSFGPMNAAQLQEIMTGLPMSAEAWKIFWDAARKQLKQNPLVEFPAKRADPLRLLDRAKNYDSAWLDGLRAERDASRIFELVAEIKSALPPEKRTGELLGTVENRLAFVILGAGKLHWDRAAQAVVLGHELGVAWHSLCIEEWTSQFLQDAIFLDVLRGLPVRCLNSFFAFMHEIGAENALALFLRVLPDMASSPLSEGIEYLRSTGRMPQVLAAMRELLGAGRASCEIIYWLCRRAGTPETGGIGTAGALAMEALSLLALRETAGERLKAKHQLRALFEQPSWLKAALDSMSADQRRDFVRRLNHSPAWATVDRRAILARILKLYPELSSALQDESPPAPAPAARLTSLRSYRERQALLSRIVSEDIPRNSSDIAVARGFGDLRENFEYKSAKETQGILMRRRAELESQLAEVKSADFEQCPTPVAGPGTRVVLRYADGKTEIYHILGEWDNDEARGIISSRCKIGEAITGHRAGDAIGIPTASGNIPCTLAEVGGLPPEIKAWIRGGV